MLYTERLSELGATPDQLSHRLKARVKTHEKLRKKVDEYRAKKEEGKLSEKLIAELTEGEEALAVDNEDLIEQINKWHRNKDINAQRAGQLKNSRGGATNTAPAPDVITAEMTQQLSALGYNEADVGAMDFGAAQQIIAAGTAKAVEQTPAAEGGKKEKKSSGGAGLILGGILLVAAAVFGIKYVKNNS